MLKCIKMLVMLLFQNTAEGCTNKLNKNTLQYKYSMAVPGKKRSRKDSKLIKKHIFNNRIYNLLT
jgi:hypothetical protein